MSRSALAPGSAAKLFQVFCGGVAGLESLAGHGSIVSVGDEPPATGAFLDFAHVVGICTPAFKSCLGVSPGPFGFRRLPAWSGMRLAGDPRSCCLIRTSGGAVMERGA